MNAVLALDLGLRTGWALGTAPYEHGTFDLSRVRSSSRDLGALFDAFGEWLGKRIDERDIETVVFERPIIFPGRASGARILFGLSAITELVCYARAVPAYELSPTEIKRHATGKGNAKKQQMFEAAKARGWNPQTLDEADALWIVDFALMKLRTKL